jgi:hypothetical protein
LNKIILENFPNLGKEMVIQIEEAFRTLNSQDKKRTSQHHTIIKTLSTQNKERIVKAAREKCYITFKANLSE